MAFPPKDRSKIVLSSFLHCVSVGKCCVLYQASSIWDIQIYVFCIIINSNADDADIQREIINMFIRTNILIRKFSKCCIAVRVTMFKAYCLCLHDAAFWKQYNICRQHSIKCGHVIIILMH